MISKNKINCKNIIIIVFLFISFSHSAFSQGLTQTIKGKVVDSESQISLPGASIIILGSDPIIGTVTNIDGDFRLEEVPVGRVSLQISFIGYDNQYISELLVSSGKEVYLTIPLKEAFETLSEVVITANVKRDEAINEMATLSARTFSVEDAKRFAGGLDDPSRLASSFAGVTPSSIDNNEIVVRGNAAKGILWRLEGVEIPAPNHLAGMFSGGGVNTMFSSNMLANSDFLTGAFPAEYGNAISGVFDMKLRSGNQDKREYAFQVGSQGVDFTLEGPFVKGKRSTYLVNYRYSTIGLLQGLMPEITGLPTYSDLSIKLVFPTKKFGVFSFWSINGMGDITNKMDKDTTKWDNNMDCFQYNISYDLTASGINNKLILSKKSFLSTSVSFSGTEYKNKNDYYRRNLLEVPFTNQNETNSTLRFISYLNHKFSKKHSNRTGIILSQMSYKLNIANNTNLAINDKADFFVNSKGSTFSSQIYTQTKYYLAKKLNVNAGIHFVYFDLNNEFIVEPRFGINWKFLPKHSLNFAYGKHSRVEPLRVYMAEVPVGNIYEKLNAKLNVTKAHHFVIGYDVTIGNKIHLNIEPYYQLLYDVPVIVDSSFSMLNYTSETFFTEQLVSNGTGENFGIDITIEQFMNKGFYYTITSSLYQSKYKADDGVERNTRYNQNFVFNVLAGKEWKLCNDNIFGINGKVTILGGKREMPVDYDESIKYQYIVYDETNPYENQLPTNYYLDISLNYTINRPKCSHSIILQAKNLLMQQDSFGYAYYYDSNSVEPYGLTIIYPFLSYKITF